MRKIIQFSFILIILFSGCEETKVDIEKFGSLHGSVLDGNDYTPIYGVLISTNPASEATLTTEDGTFNISKLKIGDVAITAHKNDYLSNSVSIAVHEDETTNVVFFLLKDEKDVGWVEIYDPVPGNGAIDQKISFTMQWKVDQQYPSKELVYTVYYFSSNSTVQNIAGENLTTKEVVINDLAYNETYYWYVVAKYEGQRVANSPTWSFRTKEEPIDTTNILVKKYINLK